MHKSLLLLALSCSFCFASCTKTDLQSYYYSYRSLKNKPTVYAFRSEGTDAGHMSYVYVQVKDEGEKSYFVSQSYTNDFQPEQFTLEEIVSSGTLMREAKLFETDSLGKARSIPMKILQPAVFPYSVTDTNSRFIYEVEWQPTEKDPNHKRHLVRNRNYIGDTTWVFDGRKVDAVMFRLRDELEDKANGSLILRYDGIEIYARGLGLVYYRRNINEDMTIAYRLEKQMTMSELENRMRDYKK